MGVYVVWSAWTIVRLDNALSKEKERVYAIADFFEVWKDVSISSKTVRVEDLRASSYGFKLYPFPAETNPASSDSKFFAMYYRKLEPNRKEELKRYFSDLVLGHYFYLEVGLGGEIRDFFWDKP